MAVPISVAGLDGNNYLFNNPIWLDVSDIGISAKFLRLLVQSTTNSLTSIQSRFFVLDPNEVSFDLSEFIKGLCKYPQYPSGILVNDAPILTNYYQFTITLQGVNADGLVISSYASVKTFIRGGLENQETNRFLPNNTLLKESVKIPAWTGYELRTFRIVNNQITSTTIVPSTIVDQRPIQGCNQLYFRFLNMLGGYSYWLFENWNVVKSTSKTQVIKRRGNDISTGQKSNYVLNVESRVDRRYFKLIRALIQSPEIYVLGLSDKIDAVSGFTISANKWEQVWNRGNSTSIDSIQLLNEVKLNFDYISTMKSETIW